MNSAYQVDLERFIVSWGDYYGAETWNECVEKTLEHLGDNNHVLYCTKHSFEIGNRGAEEIREDIKNARPALLENISRFGQQHGSEVLPTSESEPIEGVSVWELRFEDDQGNLYDTEIRILRRVPNFSGLANPASDEDFINGFYEGGYELRGSRRVGSTES